MNSMTLPDGRNISWREAGSGPPLVLLHGWSMSSAVFGEAIAELAGRYRVLAPDLRGHGASSPGDQYTLEALAGDLLCWLDQLEAGPVNLLGWSLGGQVSLQLVLGNPARFRKLVLVATTPRFVAGDIWPGGLPGGQVKAMARQLKQDYHKTMGDFFRLMFSEGEVDDERYRELIRFAVREGRLPAPEVAIEALTTLQQADLRQQLSAVKLPVLVEHGVNDAITPVAAGRHLVSAIPGAKSLFHHGLGHAPFLSRPDESFSAWQEFLA